MIKTPFHASLTRPLFQALTGIAMTGVLAACSGGGGNGFDLGGDEDVNPYQELIDQGVGRYLGEFTPMLSETTGDMTIHRFGTGDGPTCLRGTEYAMSTRDTGSEDLVIFLQGGGGCWDTLCAAQETVEEPEVPDDGILNRDLAGNPVADWNVSYLPYCDGGVHASDVEHDIDNNGIIEAGTTDQIHHGLQNMSAALDVTVQTFPSPRRILLTGVSGGGFGTIFALPLVRTMYPDVPIEVINDSGVAVGRPGEPEFFTDLLTYWNALDSFIPPSCPNCIDEDGHGTGIFNWALERDDNLRISLMSHKQDAVIAGFFFEVPGPVWEAELISEMAEVEAANPERLRSLVADGTAHTFLGSRTGLEVDGITVLDWVTAMLDDSADWTSRLD
jgi:Pectinacetylesterase